jgi:hypothetical protein
MATEFQYLDVLDTVKLTLRHGDSTRHARQFAQARISLAVILGRIPVLSHAQVFDSSVLLPGEANDAGFLDLCHLFSEGHIQVRPFGSDTVLDAFQTAVARPIFEFSGWPEIPEEKSNRSDDPRGAILAFFKDKKRHELPESVTTKLHALIELSEAEKGFNGRSKALGSTETMPTLIKKVQLGLTNEPKLKKVLSKLEGVNDRSTLYKVIREHAADETVRNDALEIVNICYNRMIAKSLGQCQIELTASELTGVEAAQLILDPGSEIMEAQVSSGEPPTNLKMLLPVDWTILRHFRDELPNGVHSTFSTAKGAKFLAGEIAGNDTSWYGMLVKSAPWIVPTVFSAGAGALSLASPNPGFQAVVWGGSALMGALGSMAAGFSKRRLETNLKGCLGQWSEKASG